MPDTDKDKDAYSPLTSKEATADKANAASPALSTKTQSDIGITPMDISRCKKFSIALLRSGILLLFLGSVLALMYWLRQVWIRPSCVETLIPAELDFCQPDGPRILSQVLNGGEAKKLEPSTVKIASFRPTGSGAKELGLPIVTYYASEEAYATTPSWSMGLSFGFLTTSDYHFHVVVNDVPKQKKCMEKLAGEVNTVDGENTVQEVLWGQAIVHILKKAKRRTPHAWIMTSPAAHGALLIRADTNQVWSSAAGAFLDKYEPSAAWHCYLTMASLSAIALSLLSIHIFGSFAYKHWCESTEIWAEQYGYSWHHVMGEPDAPIEAPPMTRSVSESHLKSVQRVFQHKYQAMSLFFLFDHLVDNTFVNAEKWTSGIMSAVIDGISLSLLAVGPIVCGVFFPYVKLVMWPITALYLIFTMLFGVAYFFGVRWRYRKPLFWMHVIFYFSMLLFFLVYVSCAVVFIITRLIVDPVEVQNYAAAVGSVIVIAGVMVTSLMRARDNLKAKLSGEKRGLMIAKLRELGLDLKSIIVSVSGLVVFILLMAAVGIFASEMYFGATTASKMMGTLMTPVTGAMAAMKKLEQQKEAMATQVGSKMDEHMSLL